jgi:hypothetical protein
MLAERGWDRRDREKASTVCASYGAAGILVRLELIDFAMLESWGPSIRTCFEICKPLIIERRQTAGPNYWIDFDGLYEKFNRQA